MSLLSYGVVGGRDFNNYYLVINFLRFIAPSRCEIVSGGASGADYLGKCYAEFNNLPYVEYPADWDKHGKAAGFIRNKDIAEHSDKLIAFHDGKSKGTLDAINQMLKMAKRTMVVIYDERDVIKPHQNVVHCKRDSFDLYIGRDKKEPSKWGNPFPLKDEKDRLWVIHRYTDYLVKEGLVSQVQELDGKRLGCFCSPKLCHGDMLTWILENRGQWSHHPKFELVPCGKGIHKTARVQFWWRDKFDIHSYLNKLSIDQTKYRPFKLIV